MEGEFEEPELFQARYQRNNKRGGLKNLRCFPTCASLHRERGFCGRMVVLKIKKPAAFDRKFIVYGEFLPVSDKNVGLKIEDAVTQDRAREICRDKLNPTKPWIDGELLDECAEYARYAFNRDKKGWHYGWASNKHTCNASHALQAYVMEESGDKLVVKGVFQSPQFTLFCRRRRRFAMVPSAPIAPPSSKKRNGRHADGKAEGDGDDDDASDEDIYDEEEDGDVDSPAEPPSPEAPIAIVLPAEQTKKLSKVTKMVKTASLAISGSKKRPNKRARTLIVEEATSMPGGQVAREARDRELRVERMLRELSKRLTLRAKPFVVSRPNSPSNANEQFSSTDSASTATTEERHLTQAQFASHLFECIDFFAGDSLLDDQLLEGDFLRDFASSTVDDERARFIDELAEYLLEERGFTDAIYGLSKAAKESIGPQHSEAFERFVLILDSYLNMFLTRKGYCSTKFDQLFPPEHSDQPFETGGQILARTAFREIMITADAEDASSDENSQDVASLSVLSAAPVISFDVEGVEKMSGAWILSAGSRALGGSNASSSSSTDDGIESIRESLGYPWILRKMLSAMEEKFHINVVGNVLTVRLQRRLFASGAMTIVLDGEEHDWGMKLPMFEGISQIWKYRAWVNDGVVHHVHETGDHSRMKRVMWVDEDGLLNVDISLEEFNNEYQRWETIARALQRAIRCD